MWVKGNESNFSAMLKKLAELANKLAELNTKSKATSALRYARMLRELETRKAAQQWKPESEDRSADRISK